MHGLQMEPERDFSSTKVKGQAGGGARGFPKQGPKREKLQPAELLESPPTHLSPKAPPTGLCVGINLSIETLLCEVAACSGTRSGHRGSDTKAVC